jgi:tRNA modification GTPase
LTTDSIETIKEKITQLSGTGTPFIAIGNKKDKADEHLIEQFKKLPNSLLLSATKKEGIDALKETVLHKVHLDEVKKGDVIVTNIRHYQNLLRAKTALLDVQGSIDSGITNDFLAMELKHALSALSEITGEEITTEDLLENIFSKFCIGK